MTEIFLTETLKFNQNLTRCISLITFIIFFSFFFFYMIYFLRDIKREMCAVCIMLMCEPNDCTCVFIFMQNLQY